MRTDSYKTISNALGSVCIKYVTINVTNKTIYYNMKAYSKQKLCNLFLITFDKYFRRQIF